MKAVLLSTDGCKLHTQNVLLISVCFSQ